MAEKAARLKDREGIDILRAIDLANAVRKVGGYELLEDLKPGEPANTNSCVLAKTFNCSCSVTPILSELGPENTKKLFDSDLDHDWKDVDLSMLSDTAVWAVCFTEKKYAEALAKELGFQVRESEIAWIPSGFYVLLPFEVGKIASKFDDYLLPIAYYEGNLYQKSWREVDKRRKSV